MTIGYRILVLIFIHFRQSMVICHDSAVRLMLPAYFTAWMKEILLFTTGESSDN